MSKEGDEDRFANDQNEAVTKAGRLADLVLEMPERFVNGDEQVAQESLGAMKAILDFGMYFDVSVIVGKQAFHTETEAIESLSKHLGSAMEESQARQTRAGKGNKRKRGNPSKNEIFGPTDLDEMTIQNVNEDQLWSQIELKNEKMNAFLDAAMVETNGIEEEQKLLDEEEEEDEEALDEVQKKRRKESIVSVRAKGGKEEDEEDDEDDLGAMPKEQVIHNLKDLTDAELKSLGLDPSKRAELEALDFDDGDFTDDEEEEEEDDEDKYGYAGASDLSDDDEMRGKIVLEPLRTEEQQRKRQAQVAAEERQKSMMQMQLRRMMGAKDDDEEDNDEEDEFEGLDEEEEEDDESDESYDGQSARKERDDNDESEGNSDATEEDSEDSEDLEAQRGSRSERHRLSSLLDNLDANGSDARNAKKWKSHPTLDDAFFSIDQFNRDTDDYGDEGIDLGEDVDLFKAVEEEEEEPILYSDFFAPPPGGHEPSKVSSDQKKEVSTTTTSKSSLSKKPSLVRFHEEVSVRRIKPCKKNEMDITPELLMALRRDIGEEKESDDEEEEDDDAEEDDDEESEGEEESMSDDQEEGGEDDEEEEEDLDRAKMDLDNSDVESDIEGQGESDAEQETVQRVAGDLFADEPEEGKGKKQSSYERRLETLQQEIARLEQENVAKKDWTLMGESGSRTRPENSLLAESLDFENNQRAKPVITPETTNTLEDLIRKRILESQFDDVERRANVEQFDFLPSKMLELSDSKSNKSLDQIYEDEMGMGGGSGASHGEKMDKQLAQDHQEISQLYDELEYKLDALSNAHFTPKAPKATIQTISNAPTITLEESLPSTSNYASQLAPEEVYDAGRHNTALQGERSEMTPEEKKRLQKQLRADKKARNERIDSVKRNVEINKEAFAKNRGGKFVGSGKKGSRNDAKEKEEALHKLMGNRGVTVVGKGGEEKKKKKQQNDSFALNASHLKL